MNESLKVVFDCNIFLQALSNPNGPSGRCVSLVFDGTLSLFISPHVLDEIRDVTSRPELIVKFRLRPQRVQAMIENLPKASVFVPKVPEIWTYLRDPDDAHYVNLALAVDAKLIVSRDRDLLDLMESTARQAIDFRVRFPSLRITDPVRLLKDLQV